MIPLLSLGVPGDSVTAVMIGAFVIHGLQPGPLMFKEQQGLVHAVFALVLLAHLLVFVREFGHGRSAALPAPGQP
jgi:putative tricarboxylic transport membrane protein